MPDGLKFEQLLDLYLAGTVPIPAPHETAKLEVIRSQDRETQLRIVLPTKELGKGKPAIHEKRTVLLRHVSAVFVVNGDGAWYMNRSEDCWWTGKELTDLTKAGVVWNDVENGIAYVPENAPVLIESNKGPPLAILACELDDVEEMYGPPGKCSG